MVDLTADVDFAALVRVLHRYSAEALNGMIGDGDDAAAKVKLAGVQTHGDESGLESGGGSGYIAGKANDTSRGTMVVSQGEFLANMGMPQRLMQLIESDDTSDEQAEALVASFERLVDPEQMGERYKVLAFVDARQTAPPPGGFGPPQHVK